MPLAWRRRGDGITGAFRALLAIARLYRVERPDIAHHVALKSVLFGGVAARLAFPFARIRPHLVAAVMGLGSRFGRGGLVGRLLEPALRETERFLPRHRHRPLEGVSARRGIVYADLYNAREGALRAVPGLDRPPFEITLATPRAASVHLQVEALHVALTTILAEFRYLQVIGQNI